MTESLLRADEPITAATPPPVHETGTEAGLATLKDNLEAIAIAIIMALVIKHFCVEAFKIPTSSMLPTLRGEGDAPNDPESDGDRILVDKWAYFLHGPRRWDVIVFKYPLNRSRNFIKRVAGLPNEDLRISEDGEIWVRPTPAEGEPPEPFRIARKTRAVREHLYVPVYPPPRPGEDDAGPRDPQLNISRYWRVDEGPPNAWRLESHHRFEFTGGRRAEFRTGHRIGDSTTAARWGDEGLSGVTVRDVRFAAQVVATTADKNQGAPTQLGFTWQPDGEFQAVLVLSSRAGDSRAYIRRGAALIQEAHLAEVLTPDEALDVEMEYVDGDLRVRLDGDEVAVLPDGRTLADTQVRSEEQRFTISAEGGPLRVEDLRIDRDLRHGNDWVGNRGAGQNGVHIPDDCYVMLGDNTHNSSDSRKWQLTTVNLRDGRRIRYEKGTVDEPDRYDPERKRKRRHVVDADGIDQTWFDDEEDPEKGSPSGPAPFVHRDLIVGRAFLVFWPCTPDFPGRLHFLH